MANTSARPATGLHATGVGVGGVIVTASGILVAKVPTGAQAPSGDHKWLVLGCGGDMSRNDHRGWGWIRGDP